MKLFALVILLLLGGCVFDKQYVLVLGTPDGNVAWRKDQHTHKLKIYNGKEDCMKDLKEDEEEFTKQGFTVGNDFALLCLEYDKVKEEVPEALK